MEQNRDRRLLGKKQISAAFMTILAIATIIYISRASMIEHSTPFRPAFMADQSSKIPNIVHFVRLVQAESTTGVSEFELDFSRFVAVYSAYYHLKPDKIYIHTNAEVENLRYRLAKSTEPQLQALARLETLEFKHQDPPAKTTSGLEIEKLAHKSDFLRTSVLREHGGIYLDSDCYVLRSFDSLRRSGFHAILGQQEDGTAGNAMMMTVPDSDLITAFDRLQDAVFDGEWTTHSIKLLTALARDFSFREGEVLSLPREAIYPVGWAQADIAEFYRVSESSRIDDDIHRLCQETLTRGVTDYVHRFLNRTDPVLEKKFWSSSLCESYALHGWSSAQANMNQTGLFAEFDGINLDYVLAKRSRFAQAVYPAVKHAIDTGVLKGKI